MVRFRGGLVFNTPRLVLKTAANPILLSCDRRCPLMLNYLRPTSHGYHVAQLMEHTLELHGAGRLFFM